MTIDELRARKRELLARKKYELDLQAAGEGNTLDLFIVREELNDVNSQLMALTASRRKSGGVYNAAPRYVTDRQQYLNWRREDTALDDEIEEGRAQMRRAVVKGLDDLSPRQREMLELYLSGRNISAIAADLGVNKSTVSRNIARAKKNLREETERAMAEHKLLKGGPLVDLLDPPAAKAVILALTPKQTVYFFLYYSECLTFRAIEELTGTDHAAIVRTVRRALRNLDKLLGGQNSVLEHPEALDELAFQAYCQLEDHPELLPEGAPVPVPYCPPEKRNTYAGGSLPSMSSLSVLVQRAWRGNAAKPPGKLLSALLKRQEKEGGLSVFRWLEMVFTALLTKLRKRM